MGSSPKPRFLPAASVVIGLLICLVGNWVYAAQRLLAKKEIPVYEDRSESDVIRTLEKGDKVPISPKTYGAWRKVLIRSPDGSRTGWVKIADIRGSSIIGADGEDLKASKARRYHANTGVGLLVSLSYMSQGARTYQDGTGAPIEIGTLSGVSNYFGLLGDFPITNTMVLRAQLNLRNTSMTGKMNFQGQTRQQPVELAQNFISLGAMLKMYGTPRADLWWGAGLELAKGNSVRLVYSDTVNVPIDVESLPIYFLVQGALGYDLEIFESFFLLPELRVGVVMNTKPISINGELLVGVSKTF